MKTLMLFRELPDEKVLPQFLELEGDFSRFDGIYINEYVADISLQFEQYRLQGELTALIYGIDGNREIAFMTMPTKDFDIFIHCGIYI